MSSIKFNFDRMRVATLRKQAAGASGFSSTGISGGGMGGFGGSGFNGFGGGGRGNSHNRFNPVFDDLSEGTIVEQFMPTDVRRLHRIWRRIYYQDPVAGPAVELYKDLPWSDFQLIGVDDQTIAQLYSDCLNAINITSRLPELSAEFLTMGKVIGHMLFDESKGFFNRMIIHDPDWIRVSEIPLGGFQPKLDLIPTPGMRAFASSKDPRDLEAQEQVPELVQMIRNGQEIPLAPEHTFYIPRRYAPYDVMGASAYTRIIMFVAYEKALVNATVASARRRASRIRHVTAGIDDMWEPSAEELGSISDLFMQADEDPVGAIVVTRTGVQVNEVGGSSPQDIVKISDEWQFLLQGKLNALGVSEAFLTGEACLVGDSLIPTTQGLLAIGEMRNREDGQWQDLNLEVDSRYKSARTAKWLYNGYRPTIKTKTYCGNELQSTPNHPVLVLNPHTGDTDWKRTDELKIGDLLCISTRKVVRKDKLALSLKTPAVRDSRTKLPLKPEYMTPNLARILACVVAEGSYAKNLVSVSNSNENILQEYENCLQDVFGLTGSRSLVCAAGTKGVINGVSYTNNHDCYDYRVYSTVAKQWLQDLGALDVKSKDKQVPWAILQADEESQLAFLGAYLDCDGSIHPKKGQISFLSKSPQALRGIQAILNSHGFVTRRTKRSVELTRRDSKSLWDSIKQYVVSKSYPDDANVATKARNRFGVPNEFLKNLLNERKTRHNRNGSYYLNDEGVEVLVPRVRNPLTDEKMFLYDRYAAGAYDAWLDNLKSISLSVYRKLLGLFENKYLFSPIVSIEDGGRQHVYDISMEAGTEPAFVANGLVVHNTYNTLEQLMSVFLEKVKAHRSFFVQNLIKEKILKPLAIKHNFVRRKKAEVDHRIRIAQDVNERDYIIPTLAWAKSLRPVADRDYLEILGMMEEKGIPVTIRTWSSAAGFDLDSEMDQFSNDVEARRQMSQQKKKVTAVAPEMAQQGGGGGLGGDALGGLGGDLGGLGGGMDMGGLGGGMDMGGLGGGGGGDMGGLGGADAGGAGAGGAGAGGAGGLALPAVGASFRVAAVASPSEVPDSSREFAAILRNLPFWDRKNQFMTLGMDQAELTMWRLLDFAGSKTARTMTKGDMNNLLSTGNKRRDDVLKFVLSRVGVLRNAAISREVGIDLQEKLSSMLGSHPDKLAVELSAVAACVATGLRDSKPAILDRPENARLRKASSMQKKLVSRSELGGTSLLTGYVDDPKQLKDE